MVARTLERVESEKRMVKTGRNREARKSMSALEMMGLVAEMP